MRRSKDELDKMRRAGKVVAEMHEKTRAFVRPGVTTAQINEVSGDRIRVEFSNDTSTYEVQLQLQDGVIKNSGQNKGA